ncbi:ankyrin repeat domain-containing protein [Halarcobacter sp.]|uniref:ankyrin repeat domain-containing protein n=1 Tax=Halarcobacter sp. TaxID=2321133 RepID=UPI002AAC4AFE|nr:ankyrin repeat domain-containing protein [Halarcobacter sp.]
MSKKLIYLFFIVTIFIFTGCVKKENQLNLSDISAKKENTIGTTIHDAVRINDLELVKTFINKGVDLNKKDRFGYTPLHLAARFNHFDIAKLLVEKGADVNTKDKYGDTPLIDSTRNGYTNVSKLLICNGANRDTLDKYEMSALHYASKTNDVYISKLLRADDIEPICSNKEEVEVEPKEQFYNLITIDDNDVINDNTPKICGNIIDSDVKQVQITFDGGKTVTEAELKDNRWCAQVETKVENGTYNVMAMAINSASQRGKVEDELKIYVINELYDVLNDEFKDDFAIWNAQLDEDTLTFRFKDPAMMFKRGSSKINDKYKKILNQFFPKYVNILKNYNNEIINIHVEGHTSSRYRTAPTPEEKFEKNKILSQKRADAILEYLEGINNSIVLDNKNFIQNTFIPEGKSSSEVIYNKDGSENYELSRRVEFRIETR